MNSLRDQIITEILKSLPVESEDMKYYDKESKENACYKMGQMAYQRSVLKAIIKLKDKGDE